jgi:hypothetical protein
MAGERSVGEQYLLELINRARLDPGLEFERLVSEYGYYRPDWTPPTGERQPLAWNATLSDVARQQSQHWLGWQDPDFRWDGAGPVADRVAGSGYPAEPGTPVVEAYGAMSSLYLYEPVYSLGSSYRSNFSYEPTNWPTLVPEAREAGVAVDFRNWKLDSEVVLIHWRGDDAHDLGWSVVSATPADDTPFLTGVVYDDRDGDRFYTPGEGIQGATVTVAGGGSAATGTAGGYELRVAPGPRDVAVDLGDGSPAMRLRIDVGDANVKLDALGPGRVATSGDATLLSGVAELRLLGRGHDATGGSGDELLIGNRGDNRLDGGDGGDVLNGGGGDDVLVGGSGDDFIVVDGGDAVVEERSGGRDTVRVVAGSFFLPEHAEDLQLGGTAADGTGNGEANSIRGNALGNALSGLGGDDRIAGGGGDDRIDGGAGSDLLAGGAGADAFVFAPGDRLLDQVVDFRPDEGDRIDLSAFGFASDPVASGAARFEAASAGALLVLDLDDGPWAPVYLQGVDPASLDADALVW